MCYTLLSQNVASFPQVFAETSTRNTRETRFPANVAQLVEQLTRNEQVAGSSPAVGSLLFTADNLPFRCLMKLGTCFVMPAILIAPQPTSHGD